MSVFNTGFLGQHQLLPPGLGLDAFGNVFRSFLPGSLEEALDELLGGRFPTGGPQAKRVSGPPTSPSGTTDDLRRGLEPQPLPGPRELQPGGLVRAGDPGLRLEPQERIENTIAALIRAGGSPNINDIINVAGGIGAVALGHPIPGISAIIQGIQSGALNARNAAILSEVIGQFENKLGRIEGLKPAFRFEGDTLVLPEGAPDPRDIRPGAAGARAFEVGIEELREFDKLGVDAPDLAGFQAITEGARENIFGNLLPSAGQNVQGVLSSVTDPTSFQAQFLQPVQQALASGRIDDRLGLFEDVSRRTRLQEVPERLLGAAQGDITALGAAGQRLTRQARQAGRVAASAAGTPEAAGALSQAAQANFLPQLVSQGLQAQDRARQAAAGATQNIASLAAQTGTIADQINRDLALAEAQAATSLGGQRVGALTSQAGILGDLARTGIGAEADLAATSSANQRVFEALSQDADKFNVATEIGIAEKIAEGRRQEELDKAAQLAILQALDQNTFNANLTTSQLGLAGLGTIASILQSAGFLGEEPFFPAQMFLDLLTNRSGGGGGGGFGLSGGVNLGELGALFGGGAAGGGLGGSLAGAAGGGIPLAFAGGLPLSSRRFKKNIQPVPRDKVRRAFDSVATHRWEYLDSDEEHIGPMAEDLQQAGFGDGITLPVGDMLGLLWSEVQHLRSQVARRQGDTGPSGEDHA